MSHRIWDKRFVGGQMSSVNIELFGKDPKVLKSLRIAQNVSVTKAPVLITGEIGIGKRAMARFIHSQSSRAEEILEIVDCSKTPEEVENTILGFRDSMTEKFVKGVLELSSRGTIVLANIDSLEENFQKRFHKIIYELPDYDIDLRFIATTTKNLSKLVGSGRFYRGLYTLFSSNTITLPPLRERINDLESLTRHYIMSYSLDTGKDVTIDDSAMNKILSHYWTHNVKELKTVLENSIANVEDNSLSDKDLEIGEKKAVKMIANDDNEGIRLMSLKEAEKILIKKALIHTSENRTQAAKILGVSIRTLRNKINEYRNNGSVYFINLR